MASIAFLAKSRSLLRPQNFKSISTFVHLHQEAQLEEPTPPPLPPNPAFGSPRYNENWRSPASAASAGDSALVPVGLEFLQSHASRMQLLSQSLDAESLNNQFADWTTSNRWEDMKQLFEFWIRSLDNNGKPNIPDVDLYNVYLRANLMINASVGELLDLVARMEDYAIFPNTASYNIVLKAMHRDRETVAAQRLIERMCQAGKLYKESLPDAESYDLVIDMLLSADQIDAALKYIDLTLTSGYMFSRRSFEFCVLKCVYYGRLDTLVSIIERCKKMGQNKSLCPNWKLCNNMAEAAIKADNSQLTFYAFEFMARWITRGEIDKTPVPKATNEGLIVSALGTAGRTYNLALVDGAWAILKRSLLKKKAPNPESYVAKISAYANLGNLQKAFITLHEFENDYGNSDREDREELFSPFYSLNPLVVAFSKNGFTTLDSIYYKLETLSQSDKPYKSIAALNCVILGCANTWDVDRAYQTFHAIDSTFGLTPNIHSYNALICSFGKLNKSDEAVKVFEHFVGIGVKPNATTFSLLVDALLVKRDPRAALSMVDEMIIAGYEPSKEMLKKIRRRSVREMDIESDRKIDALAKQFNIRMGKETRKNILFQLQYTTTDYA
ncbi:hypothetical protein CASFOL_020755 [Castilleja foliolosa]|uniref:Pentatricopeptide repeat-containing protein-mitochondrial domain-containing protein n=1 Tax=Castilleja foliolosa TaxID=1961234 RepID=A0ABD3D1S0_9LAMI